MSLHWSTHGKKTNPSNINLTMSLISLQHRNKFLMILRYIHKICPFFSFVVALCVLTISFVVEKVVERTLMWGGFGMFSIWCNRLSMGTMFASLHMDKQVQERLLQFMGQILTQGSPPGLHGSFSTAWSGIQKSSLLLWRYCIHLTHRAWWMSSMGHVLSSNCSDCWDQLLMGMVRVTLFNLWIWFWLSMCCYVLDLGLQVYMLEIYQDTLIDLLLPKNGGKPKRLEIKKDPKVALKSCCFLSVISPLFSLSLTILLTTCFTLFSMFGRNFLFGSLVLSPVSLFLFWPFWEWCEVPLSIGSRNSVPVYSEFGTSRRWIVKNTERFPV